ncbi:MAG: TolC family protein [Bacteroidota bacterium]|jgi:outer membrane protein TolC|nr:TolC family protein [Bacteroidota bacterium]
MHRLSNFLLFVIALAAPIVMHAQAPRTMSLDDARTLALEHNTALVNAGLAVDESHAKLREVVAAGLPQVNATADYSNFFGSSASLGNFPGMTIEFKPTSNLGITVSQLVFSGAYIVGIQTAKLAAELAETSRRKSRAEVLAQVTQTYALCQASEKLRAVVEANLANMDELLRKTRAMVDVGMLEELDYDQLAVQHATLADALRAAERQRELAENMLRLITGLPADASISLTEELEAISARHDARGNRSAPFVLEESHNFRLLTLQKELADKQVNLQKVEYLPTIAGFYSYTEKLLKPEFDLTPKHVIGLNLQIPLFTGFARMHRVEQASIRRDIAENQLAQGARELRIQEKQLRYNLSNAREHFERQRETLAVARRVFESMRNKYQQGRASSLDLTTANGSYLQAESGFHTALLQLINAQVELDTLLDTL